MLKSLSRRFRQWRCRRRLAQLAEQIDISNDFINYAIMRRNQAAEEMLYQRTRLQSLESK